MSTLQITVFISLAGCAIGCLLGICKAIERLSKGIFSIGAELTKLNAKLESIETVNSDDPKRSISKTDLVASIDGALRALEKL